jgi:parallel beta-helix repeat protein
MIWKKAKPTSLKSLSDVDVTSLEDGHTLIYDEKSNKFVLRPFPYNQSLKTNTLLPSQQDNLLTFDDVTNHPISIKSNQTYLTLEGIETSSPNQGIYTIELERWGIQTGIPEKPYQPKDYQTAMENINGINSALTYAHEQGYSHVILPRGEYAICFPTPIQLKSNQTFDCMGATIKVIYDSDNRSPFDTKQDRHPSFLEGNAIEFNRGVRNSHLRGLKLIGDRYERSFQYSEERRREGSYGVVFRGDACYCSVSHCYIAGFMGDQIRFVAEGYIRTGSNGEGSQVLGRIDESTGEVLPDTNANSIVSALISIPTRDKPFFTIGGQGYSRTTRMNNKRFHVYYYQDGIYLGRLIGNKVQAPVTIPKHATHMRLMYLDESDPKKQFDIFIRYGGDCHHNVVEFNELADGHRGGIQPGGSYNIIQYNKIRDNGSNDGWLWGGIPTFPDSTRYGINQEDSYGDNTIIRGNHIYGSFHAILVGTYSVFIENNVINNCNYGIRVYGMEYGSITNNYIQVENPVSSSGTSLLGAVQVIGNYCLGDISLGNATYECIVKGNHVVGGGLRVGSGICEGNLVTLSKNFYEHSGKLEGDSIRFNQFKGSNPNDSKIFVYPEGSKYIEYCTFYNIEIEMRKAVTYRKCKFYNCRFLTGQTTSEIPYEFLECEFYDSRPMQRTKFTPLTFKNCRIQFSKNYTFNHFILSFSTGPMSIIVKIVDCDIKTAIPLLGIIESNYLTKNTLNYEIKNTFIEYTGEDMLELSINRREATVYSGLIANLTLTSVNLNTQELAGEKYTLYDSSTSFMQVVTLEANGEGYEAIVSHDLQTPAPYILATDNSTGEIITLSVFILDTNTIKIISNEPVEVKIFVKRV